MFPAARAAGKNDSDSFRLAPETRKGNPLPGPFPGGRGTKVPGQLPASIGSACDPPGREAASAAGWPLRRQDEGPRSTACFYRKCPLFAWPRSGFGGGRAAAAAGRRSQVSCLLLLEVPAIRLATWRLCRREAAGVAWLKAPLWKGGRLRAPPVAVKASKKEWQWSKFCER